MKAVELGCVQKVKEKNISGDLLQYVTQVPIGPDSGKFMCSLCGKINAQKIHTLNHIESIHYPGTYEYSCKYCDLKFNGRNKLYIHVNQAHPKLKQ